MGNAATEQDLREQLKAACAAEGSQRAWALRHGLSPSFLHDVLAGRRPVTARLAAMLGYRLETVYYPMPKE